MPQRLTAKGHFFCCCTCNPAAGYISFRCCCVVSTTHPPQKKRDENYLYIIIHHITCVYISSTLSWIAVCVSLYKRYPHAGGSSARWRHLLLLCFFLKKKKKKKSRLRKRNIQKENRRVKSCFLILLTYLVFTYRTARSEMRLPTYVLIYRAHTKCAPSTNYLRL